MRCVKALEDAGLITKTKRKRGKKNETNVYQIIIVDTEVVTDSHQVVTNSHQGSDSQSLGVVTISHSELNPLELNPINSTHLTKVKDLQPAAASINQVIEVFSKISQTNLFKNTAQRKAVVELLKRHPLQDVIRVAKFALQAQGRPYAPVITTPYQLMHKWAQLAFYVKSEAHRANSKKPLVGKAGVR